MTWTWDPAQYLRFADHRGRPGLELLARIRDPEGGVRRVVDLGCGAGSLTAVLAERWPEAEIVGVDASPEMLDRARGTFPHIRWTRGDIESWTADPAVDVLYSNAAIHWLEHHDRLLPRLLSQVRPGGVFALQLPGNWDAPTHRIPQRILDEGDWPDETRRALTTDRVAPAATYRRILAPDASTVDLWETTYHHVLVGDDPVLEWVKGSLLRPVLQTLDGPGRARFEEACRRAYAEAYPREPDGVTVLPFRRVFVIATRAVTARSEP